MILSALAALVLTVGGTSGSTCGPDGLWVPTFPAQDAPIRVVGDDGTLWNILPLTDGTFVIAGPAPIGTASVSVTVSYPSGDIPVRVDAPPGCGPVTAAPATSPAAAPTGEPTTRATIEPTASSQALPADTGRDRSGMGGLIVILLLVVLAIVWMIVRSVLRDDRRGMGGPYDDPTPPAPTSPVQWAPSNPGTQPPGDRTPTVTERADPPTSLDPADPATDRYAAQVAEWLGRP